MNKTQNHKNNNSDLAGRKKFTESLRLPLGFSFTAAAFVGVCVLFGSRGGSENPFDWRLSFISAGITFIVTIIICSTLMMSYKPNDSNLGDSSDAVDTVAQDREAYTSAKRREIMQDKDNKDPSQNLHEDK